jgi:hypothetical protein
VTTPDLAAPRAELRPTLPVPARAEPSPQPPTVAVAPDTAARDVAPAEEPAAPPPPPVPTIEHRIAPPPAAPRAAAPAPAAARSSSEIQELVVTSERRQDSRREVPAALLKRGSPAELALALRDAAGAGRIADLKALLARGVPVDAPDDEGETALMKAIQADQPAAAALLRRHRASVDLKNRAGVSARDMATAMDDAELNRALGLRR